MVALTRANWFAGLQRNGWKAAAIHGDASQAARNAAIEQFRAGTVPLLIAIDISALAKP
jgi:superfamily II DNA/RNA helicase